MHARASNKYNTRIKMQGKSGFMISHPKCMIYATKEFHPVLSENLENGWKPIMWLHLTFEESADHLRCVGNNPKKIYKSIIRFHTHTPTHPAPPPHTHKPLVKESRIVWINEWMDERIHEWMNGWMDGWMNLRCIYTYALQTRIHTSKQANMQTPRQMPGK